MTLTGKESYPAATVTANFNAHSRSMTRKTKTNTKRPPRRQPADVSAAPQAIAASNGMVAYRPPTFNRTLTHRFWRQAAPITITSSTVAETLFAFNFQLSYLPSYTEFTALYDQYKIEAIDIGILPSAVTSTPADPSNGYVVLAVDYDDASTPANVDTLLQYGSAEVFPINSAIRFRLRPRLAKAAYSGAFTSYANEAASWIDVGSPSVQHYGLKFGCSATTTSVKWQVFARYHFQMRSSR